MFQQLSVCESANLQKLGGAGVGGKTVCHGAFVSVRGIRDSERGDGCRARRSSRVPSNAPACDSVTI